MGSPLSRGQVRCYASAPRPITNSATRVIGRVHTTMPPFLSSILQKISHNFPDPSLRYPPTLLDVAPLFLATYVQAVLVLLPHTRILRLSFLPVVIWLGWHAIVHCDFSLAVAPVAIPLGYRAERLEYINFRCAVRVHLLIHFVPHSLR